MLLDTFKPIAIRESWHWVGTDLSEAASMSEESMAVRLLTDLSVIGSTLTIGERAAAGFAGTPMETTLGYHTLIQLYQSTPGLAADKLKAVLEVVATAVAREGKRGVIFAYDEAQNLADQPAGQFQRSLLLDVFQSIQRKNVPFMLVYLGCQPFSQSLLRRGPLRSACSTFLRLTDSLKRTAAMLL